MPVRAAIAVGTFLVVSAVVPAHAGVPIVVSQAESPEEGTIGPGWGAWAVRADGGGESEMLQRLEQPVWWPSWDPRRERLFFVSERDGRRPEIYRARLGARSAERITTNALYEYEIDVAPRGRRIVCVGDDATSADIYTVSASNGAVRRLTSSRALDSSPSWSPDGYRIVWVRDGVLWLMGGRGSGKREFGGGIEGADPTWSPNARWITYVGSDGNIVGTHPDGDGLRVFVSNAAAWGTRLLSPMWAPDGKRLAFVAARYDDVLEGWITRLFVVRTDGGRRPVDITPSMGVGMVPIAHDW